MKQHLCFVLLLATFLASAENRSEAQQAAGAAPVQAKTEAAQGRPEHVQAKAEKPQTPTKEEQAKAEKEQKPTEEAQASKEADAKLDSVPGGKALGMSVLGNQEAPKSLVIVPWKDSELGRSMGIEPMLDSSRQPVDKEVFMRALRYYEIRSGTKP